MINQKLMMLAQQAQADCGIIDSMIEEYEWNPGTTTHAPKVIHIAGTVYAMIYEEAASSNLRITTINIASDGNIGSIIQTANVSTADSQSEPSAMKVSQAGGTGGDCVLAIFNKRKQTDEGGTEQTIVRTWRVSQAGAINGQIDFLEMGSGGVNNTYTPSCMARRSVDSIVFGSAYFGNNYNAIMYTYSILDNGTISDSVLDGVIVDSTYNDAYNGQVIEVGYKFIVNYRLNGENKNVFKSYSIHDPLGTISYLHSKDMEHTANPVSMLDMTHMGFDGLVCAYKTDANRNKLASYAVGGTGVFTGPIDTIYMDLGAGNDVHISSLGGNGIIGLWRNASNGGYISTVTMDINGNFSDIISTQVTNNRTIYYFVYPFQVQGENNGIYGISFGGNSLDGYLQTYPVTNTCI